MNNCFLRIFTFLIVSVTTFSLESIEKDFEINIPFYEDSRNWSRGQFGEDQLVRCAEYFLDGEVRENWSELVTTQYFVSRFDFSLDDFFRKVSASLLKLIQEIESILEL